MLDIVSNWCFTWKETLSPEMQELWVMRKRDQIIRKLYLCVLVPVINGVHPVERLTNKFIAADITVNPNKMNRRLNAKYIF
jgi:hypothetical protein